MKKLKLDDLKVDSFAIAAEGGMRGTVHGRHGADRTFDFSTCLCTESKACPEAPAPRRNEFPTRTCTGCEPVPNTTPQECGHLR